MKTVLLQENAWPHGEETFETTMWFGSGWPVIAIIAICVVVGGSFWYRARRRKKK